ncbi:hypothetical protein HYH03_005914 [Edaphochlamys debaryana]|uniref:Uncharacterized protein n=1 Tax=Edaphochlamys debaryana TaxID=47281 RepID=A0A835Y6D9_9CHLO|nr:hypothetical protein HYH03_005914 [Edaphochlamys debaryana]|eukprot:KAG2495989.1 hypothetical protein HYH03_005914 [Edaphochlamys debaryana]
MKAVTSAQMQDAAPAPLQCVRFIRLLSAADCFPRGGVYSGFYALQAALRYETVWCKLLQEQHQARSSPAGGGPEAQRGPAKAGPPPAEAEPMMPPLDVAYAWLVHRQDPTVYARDLSGLGLSTDAAHGYPPRQAFGFGPSRPSDWQAWAAAAGKAPAWPPPPPGSDFDLTQGLSPAAPPAFAMHLAEAMQRFSGLLHSWLRPHYLDPDFLERARGRYGRFMELVRQHPDRTLVPAADIALVWHTHMGLSGSYAQACTALYGTSRDGGVLPSGGASSGRLQGRDLPRPDYLHLSIKRLAAAYGETAQLYEQEYGEPFVDADSAWVPPSLPYPLAATRSPLLPVLRLYEDQPNKLEASDRGTAALKARACGAAGLSFAPSAVPRAGAHSIYAAWAAAKALGAAVEAAPVCGCLPFADVDGESRVARALASKLVGLAFFLDLPAYHTHPFVAAMRPKRGLWERGGSTAHGAAAGAAAEATAGAAAGAAGAAGVAGVSGAAGMASGAAGVAAAGAAGAAAAGAAGAAAGSSAAAGVAGAAGTAGPADRTSAGSGARSSGREGGAGAGTGAGGGRSAGGACAASGGDAGGGGSAGGALFLGTAARVSFREARVSSGGGSAYGPLVPTSPDAGPGTAFTTTLNPLAEGLPALGPGPLRAQPSLGSAASARGSAFAAATLLNGTGSGAGAGGGGRPGAPLAFSAEGLSPYRGPGTPTFRLHDVDHFVASYQFNFEMLGVGRALIAAGVAGPSGRAAYTCRGLGARLSRHKFVEALTRAFDAAWQQAAASNGRSVMGAAAQANRKAAVRAARGGGAGARLEGSAPVWGTAGPGAAAPALGDDFYAIANYIPVINIQVEDGEGGEGGEALDLGEFMVPVDPQAADAEGSPARLPQAPPGAASGAKHARQQ